MITDTSLNTEKANNMSKVKQLGLRYPNDSGLD